MASFTDKISQFNPYIQQLPAQEMQQVGMYKQQQYDQGVQKIQGYIDDVAGMDVIRDSDKQYLQSKLNDLGGKLRTVAAGDFSNHQLVNSVGGMATSIVKDPTIQNAVSSTQRVRSEMARAQAADKEGKSSIQNQDRLSYDISKYLNDPNQKASFTGKYQNFIDINKKLVDLADKVKESDSSIEIPYKTDAKGNVLYYGKDKQGKTIVSTNPADGQKVVDDAMLAISVKGKSAQKIYDTFRDSLSEDDINQLKIDSWHHYKNASPDKFISDYAQATELKKEMVSQEIVKLNVELSSNTNASAADKTLIKSKINSLQLKLDNKDFDKELAQNIEALKDPNNFEEVKYQSYISKTLNGLAKDLSTQSYKQAYKENPMFKANMDRLKLQEEARGHNLTYSASLARISADKEHWALEDSWKRKDWEDKHPGAIVTPQALAGMEAPTIGNLDNDIVGKKTAIKELNANYASSVFPNLKGDAAVKAMDELYSQYCTNPNVTKDPDQLMYLGRRKTFERELLRKINLKNDVEKGSKIYDDKLQKELSTMGGVMGNDGRPLATANQMYDVQKTIEDNISAEAPGVIGRPIYAADGGKQIVNFDNIMKVVGNDPTKKNIAIAMIKKMQGQPLTASERIIVNQTNDINTRASEVARNLRKEKFDYQAKKIGQLDPNYQNQVGTLNQKNVTDMNSVDQLIGNKIEQYNTLGALDTNKKSDFDPDVVQKMRTAASAGKEDINYVVIKSHNGSAKLIIQQGSKSQTIPMTSEEVSKFFPSVAKTNPLNEDKYSVQASSSKTTNLLGGRGDDPANAINAAHTGHELPGLQSTTWASKVRYDIEGSQDNDGSSKDVFALRLYVNTPQGWKTGIVNQTGYRDLGWVEETLQNIGTQTIDNALKTFR